MASWVSCWSREVVRSWDMVVFREETMVWRAEIVDSRVESRRCRFSMLSGRLDGLGGGTLGGPGSRGSAGGMGMVLYWFDGWVK